MGTKLVVEYDEVGDILYLDITPPSAEHVMVEVASGAMLRKNANTGAIEGIEISGLRKRGISEHGVEVPVGISLFSLPAIAG